MLTILTPITSNAAVVDPQANSDLRLRLKDSKWLNWLMIEEGTLRSLRSDAKKNDAIWEGLHQCQVKLEETTSMYNVSQVTVYDREQEIVSLKVEVETLKNPPWYKSPPVWGSGGFVLGVIATTVLIFSLR